MTDHNDDPGVELAPLPREQVGPYFILGVDKGADRKTIEAHWAKRVLWARQGQIPTPLEDINWAREVLRDPARRLDADADSLNLDTARGELRRLTEQYSLTADGPTWEPFDPEPDLLPAAVEPPDPAAVRATLPPAEVPLELPGVGPWLAALAAMEIDPWSVEISDSPDETAWTTAPTNPPPA